ncbi:MAG: sodium:calcium antiporter [Oscillospiraceae bacterium]
MNLDFTGSTLFLVLLLFAAACVHHQGRLFCRCRHVDHRPGIPKFIIGATVVSFATTMPELLVSLFSAFEGNADIAVGNAVGSVTANTGLILCISLVCMQCAMTRRQYAGKACLLLAAICLLFVFTRDGSLSLWESAAILAVFGFYMAESLLAGRREQGAEQPAEKPKKDGRTVAWNIGKFVLGAAAIVLGAQLLIDNGSELARRIGVPDAVIAATMIAIGTSLPELVTTIISIRKKQASLSVGNIIGANILDLTLIMPLCALLQGRPQPIERQGMLLISRPASSSARPVVPALLRQVQRWMGILAGPYIAYLVRRSPASARKPAPVSSRDRHFLPENPEPKLWVGAGGLNPHVRSGH